ncbi:sialic acid synthase [Roseibium aquae]|uniref:Sialic acid synthase n=1 Tax=Roseibium aquae TaxID=1323746 RepID=A0A916WZK1_9HYPH|nr:pseudaminic acid synthase [Roseibium aquae]GGB45670.1 sialic acid synthase [Roseibium aquae]
MTDLVRLFDSDVPSLPHICAEMSGNHQGDLGKALSFVRAAKQAGADSLKVQVYRPDTITLNSDFEDFRLAPDNDWAAYKTLHALYEKAHTPWDWIAAMFEVAKEVDLPIFASAFDTTAVDFLEGLDCPVYKVASPEITDIGLIERFAATGKPVILSTGLAEEEDVRRAVAPLQHAGTPFIILKCTSAYPSPHEALDLAAIPYLARTFSCPAGFSDHTKGAEAAIVAAAFGARLIEKHFKLPGDDTSVDAAFSMSLGDLPAFKRSVHLAAQSVGEAGLRISEAARPSLSGRRSLYVVRDVRAGEVFSIENVQSKRPSFGMPPRFLPDILGRTARRDVRAGERMSWDLIDGGSPTDDA